MALESFLVCPIALSRLRDGPLGSLTEAYYQWLIDNGYSHWTIRSHLSFLGHFNGYLREQSTQPRAILTAMEVEAFLRVYPQRCRKRGPLEQHVRTMRWVLNRFVAYLREQGLYEPSQVAVPLHQPLLEAYLHWMRTARNSAVGTLELRRRSLDEFLCRLGEHATTDGLARLTADQVESLFLELCQGKGTADRRQMQAAMRTFLRFCLIRGYIQAPLDQAVPTLRQYRLSTVPRGFTDEQALKILGAVDRTRASGLRDYAILMLLYTYGVRSGQIRALRLEEIQWSEERILFRATKSGKDIWLPLIETVGEALLAYLRQGRPTCACPQVFLTAHAPYRPLRRSSNVSMIVRVHAHAAGIETSCQGAHAFRHAFACRMLREGHSLKSIADLLGHRHLGTTSLYAKVDFNQLGEVAIEWPGGLYPC